MLALLRPKRDKSCDFGLIDILVLTGEKKRQLISPIRESEAIEVARRVVECDDVRDLEGYRALLWGDYHALVNGAEVGTTGDAEAESLARHR